MGGVYSVAASKTQRGGVRHLITHAKTEMHAYYREATGPVHEEEHVVSSSNVPRADEKVAQTPFQMFKDAFPKLKALLGYNIHEHKPSKAAGSDHTSADDERSQWEIIKAIPLSTFKGLFLSLPLAENIQHVYVKDVTYGSYHYVIFLKALNKQNIVENFVIKVPGHGTPDRWQIEDEYMLTREAEIMKHLHHTTTIPVPEILAYSPIIANSVGFPYIVMRRLPGEDAFNIWFDQPSDSGAALMAVDRPSIHTEKKRLNFLRSLARIMTELERVQFDGIGMPLVHSDEPGSERAVGKTYLWPYREDAFKMEERNAFSFTQDYLRSASECLDYPESDSDGSYDDDDYQLIGIHKILDIILSNPVFNSSKSDSFVLQHNDLDMQNILTDTDGNITGIIDWDGSLAMPRCVGHAAVPKFLRRDWFPDDVARISTLSWRASYYRQVYATAMIEAGNPDAEYTLKSAMYQALLGALYEGGEITDIIEKLLCSIPNFHVVIPDFVVLLGKGWPEAEEMLRCELGKILKPELPPTMLTADLDPQVSSKKVL